MMAVGQVGLMNPSRVGERGGFGGVMAEVCCQKMSDIDGDEVIKRCCQQLDELVQFDVFDVQCRRRGEVES